jgi:type IV fimbrial biogenesis protein FimT
MRERCSVTAVTGTRGFTALELLIAVAVTALLLTLAVPAFKAMVLDSRQAAAVNRFIHGMHVARHAALVSEADVVVCRSTDGRQCVHAGTWDTGLIVFVNRDRDDPPRVDAGEQILQVESGFMSHTILANRRAFIFRPWGLRSVNGTLTFCDERGTAGARAVVVSYTGRPRATSATAAKGALSCPA